MTRTDLVVVAPGGRGRNYQRLGESLAAVEPPAWARMLAGYCRDRGWCVRLLDCDALEMGPAAVAAAVATFAPRLVAVAAYGHHPSSSTQSMTEAGAICRAIRSHGGQPTILIGGHVSTLPQLTMLDETCDYACVGEGPVTVNLLLSALKDGLFATVEEVPGLVWRDASNEIRTNPRAPLIDMKDLHGDVWDLLPMDRYRAHNWQCFDGSPRQPYASIITSLGCPYKCEFCCINAPFDSNRYRMRSPQDVVNEICKLHEVHDVSTFKIVDEMFVLNPRHVREICEGLAPVNAALGGALNIWAYARVDTVKPEMLGLLRSAGFRWLGLGIEAGAEGVRDASLKGFANAQIVDTVRAIQAADINVIGNFIFGLPHDTRETMQATLDLALELRCEFVNLYSAMAYPGSKLFERAVPGQLPSSWEGYSQYAENCKPLPTQTLSGREVLEFRDHAFKVYFSDPGYLMHVRERFGPPAVQQVLDMLGTPLPRRAAA